MKGPLRPARCAVVALAVWVIGASAAAAEDADRAAVYGAPGPHPVEVRDLDLGDTARPLPVRVRVPQPCTAAAPRPQVPGLRAR